MLKRGAAFPLTSTETLPHDVGATLLTIQVVAATSPRLLPEMMTCSPGAIAPAVNEAPLRTDEAEKLGGCASPKTVKPTRSVMTLYQIRTGLPPRRIPE